MQEVHISGIIRVWSRIIHGKAAEGAGRSGIRAEYGCMAAGRIRG